LKSQWKSRHFQFQINQHNINTPPTKINKLAEIPIILLVYEKICERSLPHYASISFDLLHIWNKRAQLLQKITSIMKHWKVWGSPGNPVDDYSLALLELKWDAFLKTSKVFLLFA
jgi:hypothetical protein